MRLHFTPGHHPSANGQVERVNSTLEQYLRPDLDLLQLRAGQLVQTLTFSRVCLQKCSQRLNRRFPFLYDPRIRPTHRDPPRR